MKGTIRFITSPNGILQRSYTEIAPRRRTRRYFCNLGPDGWEPPTHSQKTRMSRAPSVSVLPLVVCRLVNRLRLARHVIHQQILAERVGSREVGLAAAHLSYFLNELHQSVVRRQHEGVNQHARPFTF